MDERAATPDPWADRPHSVDPVHPDLWVPRSADPAPIDEDATQPIILPESVRMPQPPDRTIADEAAEEVIELREERLIAHKDLRELGEVVIRRQTDDVPGRLEVDAYREEVSIEHVPIGRVVTERVNPWEEDDVLVVPVYEEQLVVAKRLILREEIRIRRIGTTETQLFEETLRRERLIVEDPDETGLVRETFADLDSDPIARYPDDGPPPRANPPGAGHPVDGAPHPNGPRTGFFENLVRRAFE